VEGSESSGYSRDELDTHPGDNDGLYEDVKTLDEMEGDVVEVEEDLKEVQEVKEDTEEVRENVEKMDPIAEADEEEDPEDEHTYENLVTVRKRTLPLGTCSVNLSKLKRNLDQQDLQNKATQTGVKRQDGGKQSVGLKDLKAPEQILRNDEMVIVEEKEVVSCRIHRIRKS